MLNDNEKTLFTGLLVSILQYGSTGDERRRFVEEMFQQFDNLNNLDEFVSMWGGMVESPEESE